MKKTKLSLCIAALGLALSACLENEEKIEIRADGSVHVELAARGQVFDLAGGYPIPLDPAWRSLGDSTDFWTTNIGPDTGFGVRENVRVQFPPKAGGEQQQTELRVERDFASVEAWPRWFGPETDPYRTAYMARSATLEMDRQADRTVYVFERTYHGVDHARLDSEARTESALGEDFWLKLKEPHAFDDEEWSRVRDVLADIHMDVAELFVRDAILGVYTGYLRAADGSEARGDATLPAGEIPAIVAAIRQAADELIDIRMLRRINAIIADEDGEALEALAADLELKYRDTLRNGLAVALVERGVADSLVNAILFSLEWGFTAFDHYGDLADEEFTVEVALPGILIGGNFHDAEGNRALWKFEGRVLMSGDYTLRATSVLETDSEQVRRR